MPETLTRTPRIELQRCGEHAACTRVELQLPEQERPLAFCLETDDVAATLYGMHSLSQRAEWRDHAPMPAHILDEHGL